MDSRKKVTVLVPAYNEAGQLPALHAELRRMVAASGVAYGWEFLVVDDGSTDDTQAVLRQLRAEDPRLRYVTLSRNFGKENALMAGFDYATGDCVVMMDSDLQHPVDVIPAMLREWEAGYDDVYGRRLSRGREPFVRRRLTMAYYRLLQSSTRIDVLAEMGDFRLLDRRCVDAMRALRENSRYTKGLLGWIGYRKKGVDYTPDERYGGKSRFSYRKLVNLAAEGICGFSTSPLRATTLLGLAVALGAFVYILFVLCKTLIWGESVQGYPTLMCVILFLGGCQLTAIGIIGEYIGRIYNETKRRPPYIADNINGEKV
ncbi:MAG: glycosyltransferase family 2 protein [Lepagella sp.]